MNVESIQRNDEVLGYKLIRKIGSGGYGDVWEAEAPGGLKKAIKIVYGYHDEKRAQVELKSLERIRDARHPFLLSLERIEVYNSQLIIVSELAEKSLADLANEYSAQDQQGIPRDELIGYMRDAADALDYLNKSFGLQHLDIKPENLLLVSGHAKVADFGLVKDLREVSQSLLAGMTPAYAAPELFDGRPGAFSDQYSLATVYAEMLTMTRPFSGSTPAQLAAQHMHGKPDLRLLPISDQPVVSKALAKDPKDRYKTCVQFVEQLLNRKTRKRVITRRANVRETVDTSVATSLFDTDSDNSKNQTAIFSKNGLTFNSVELEFIAPPEFDTEQAVFQPTVIVGLGKSASSVLKHIKYRMVNRYGDIDCLPAFGLLCVDTDRDALARLSVGGGVRDIRVGETLAVPLKKSSQYRNKKKLDLSWIGRRWIYNVPRNLQTEGLRPLGRLAFVDHFESICDKVADVMKRVLRAENIATTCESLAMNPPTQIKPRIILVSNIAGGIGSGMTNDFAYTLRLMAAELGITETEQIGMLMYGNEAVGRESGIASANVYSYLSELRHFADGGYPGDPRLGIPEFEDELPFEHVYALRLNNERDSSHASDLERVAEYICLSTTSVCSEFFETIRQKEKESEEFGFRSFGTAICGPSLQVKGENPVERLSLDVVQHWIGSEESIDENESKETVIQFMDEVGLNLHQVTVNAVSSVTQIEEWQHGKQMMENAKDNLVAAGEPLGFTEIDDYFDDIFDAPQWRSESVGSRPSELSIAAENVVSVEGQIVGDQLSAKILELLNGDAINLARAKSCLNAAKQRVEMELEALAKGLQTNGSTVLQMQQHFVKEGQRLSDHELAQYQNMYIQKYGESRFQEFTLRCCVGYFRVVKSNLNSTQEIVKKYAMQLALVGDNFDVQLSTKRPAKYTPTIQQMLVDSIMSERDSMVKQVEKQILEQVRENGESFLEFLSDPVRWQQYLPGMVKDTCQSVLAGAFCKISIDDVIRDNNIGPAAVRSWLNELMTESRPFVMDCGGSTTLFLGQPSKAEKSSIPDTIQECFNVQIAEASGTTGDLILCFEAENITLANVAFSVLKDAPEAIDIAKRIHSRDDIEWTSIDDLI